jgi:hypothetical protein
VDKSEEEAAVGHGVKMSNKLQLALTTSRKESKQNQRLKISGGRSVMRCEKIFITRDKYKNEISGAIDSFSAADLTEGDTHAAKT